MKNNFFTFPFFSDLVPNVFQKIIYLIGYHVTFVIFVWSYYKTIFTPIGQVPRKVGNKYLKFSAKK